MPANDRGSPPPPPPPDVHAAAQALREKNIKVVGIFPGMTLCKCCIPLLWYLFMCSWVFAWVFVWVPEGIVKTDMVEFACVPTP